MEQYKKDFENIILRDYLAIDRTKLANERTLLAYIRTFIGLLITGVGFIKFIDDEVCVKLGMVLVILSPIILFLGLYKYITLRREINLIIKN